mgnify:FL=1
MKNNKTYRKFAAAALSAALMAPAFMSTPIFAEEGVTGNQPTVQVQEAAQQTGTVVIESKGITTGNVDATYYTFKGSTVNGTAFAVTGLLTKDGSATVAVPETVNNNEKVNKAAGITLFVGYKIGQGYFNVTSADIAGKNNVNVSANYLTASDLNFKIFADGMLLAKKSGQIVRTNDLTGPEKTDTVNVSADQANLQEGTNMQNANQLTAVDETPGAVRTTDEEKQIV